MVDNRTIQAHLPAPMAERPLTDNQVEETLRQMVRTLVDSFGSTTAGETALRAAEAILLLLADSMSVIAQSGDAVETPQHIRQHLERRPLFNASDIARAVMEYREANPVTPALTN